MPSTHRLAESFISSFEYKHVKVKPRLDCSHATDEENELWLLQLPEGLDMASLAGREFVVDDKPGSALVGTMQTSDGVPIEMVKEHPHLARQCFVVANKDGALRPLRVSKRITVREAIGAERGPKEPLSIGVSVPLGGSETAKKGSKEGREKKGKGKDEKEKREKKEKKKEGGDGKSDKKEGDDGKKEKKKEGGDGKKEKAEKRKTGKEAEKEGKSKGQLAAQVASAKQAPTTAALRQPQKRSREKQADDGDKASKKSKKDRA